MHLERILRFILIAGALVGADRRSRNGHAGLSPRASATPPGAPGQVYPGPDRTLIRGPQISSPRS